MGEGRGHNVVAPAFGYDADPTYTVSPGGAYPAANLACSSCHDPHSEYRRTDGLGAKAKRTLGVAGLPIIASGSYNNSIAPTAWGAVGVYRFLGGIGYQPKSEPTAPAFVSNAPDAVAPSTYNRSESATETHVAYGQGMSEWCQNCHDKMHNDTYTSGVTGQVHPAGDGAKLGATIVANYGAYVKSGDLSGAAASSYSSLVPFEEGTNVYATLATHARTNGLQTAGPTATANVMCLSCHRAHASGFQFMTRFAHENEFMTIADSAGTPMYDGAESNTEGKIHRGLTTAEQTAAYYGRPATKFAAYQRLLCNKCHAKD
jgi:predicted CXXCH cytochrome family protein